MIYKTLCKTTDWTTQKKQNRSELRCSRNVSRSCSTSDTRKRRIPVKFCFKYLVASGTSMDYTEWCAFECVIMCRKLTYCILKEILHEYPCWTLILFSLSQLYSFKPGDFDFYWLLFFLGKQIRVCDRYVQNVF